jgi:hypothetical protein
MSRAWNRNNDWLRDTPGNYRCHHWRVAVIHLGRGIDLVLWQNDLLPDGLVLRPNFRRIVPSEVYAFRREFCPNLTQRNVGRCGLVRAMSSVRCFLAMILLPLTSRL